MSNPPDKFTFNRGVHRDRIIYTATRDKKVYIITWTIQEEKHTADYPSEEVKMYLDTGNWVLLADLSKPEVETEPKTLNIREVI